MTKYHIYTARTAKPPADETLVALEKMIGFVPNIFAVMGGKPNVLDAFATLNTKFAGGALSPAEREIVQMAVSVQNTCTYCVAGHTAFAQAIDMPAADIAAMRAGEPLSDAKLQALRTFAETLWQNKGHDCGEVYAAFLDAGYTRAHVQDVILGLCVKAFSNLTSNLLEVPLDAAFAEHAWDPDQPARAA